MPILARWPYRNVHVHLIRRAPLLVTLLTWSLDPVSILHITYEVQKERRGLEWLGFDLSVEEVEFYSTRVLKAETSCFVFWVRAFRV